MIGTTADDLAGWRYQPAATPVDETGGIASGAIHPDNPGGVLHRPLTQEALPILVARLGPVGDVEGRVVSPIVAAPLRETQVVADESRQTPALIGENHPTVARRETAPLETIMLVIIQALAIRISGQQTIIILAFRTIDRRAHDQRARSPRPKDHRIPHLHETVGHPLLLVDSLARITFPHLATRDKQFREHDHVSSLASRHTPGEPGQIRVHVAPSQARLHQRDPQVSLIRRADRQPPYRERHQ